MDFKEHVTNTVARRSSGPERSKWRDWNVDPEDLEDPVLIELEVPAQREQSTEQVTAIGQLVAEQLIEKATE